MAGKETSDAAFVGKGGQGRVFLSTHRGKETATKVVPAASRAASEAEIRAVRRHRNRHIHLVPVYTVFGFDPGEGAEGLVPPGEAQADDTIIVMERAVADIHVIMSHNTHGLGESAFVREWAMQLGHALRFLHARGIAHRDIKPENVLIGLQEGAQDARHALLALTEAAGAGVGAAAEVPGAATDVPRAATDLPDAGMPHGATSDTVDTCSSAASVSVASVALEHGFAPTDPLLGPWPAVKEELLRLVGTVNRRGDQAATVDPAVRSAAVRRLRSTFMVKLCDFGSSAIQRGSEVGQAPIVGHSACGSRRFASPEVVRAMDMGKRPEIAHLIWPGTLEQWDTVVQRGYDAAACDVYSFGLLVYALASGHLPYAAASLQEKMYRRFVATLFPHVRHSVIGAPGSELWSVKVNGPQLRRWRWPSHFSPALKHLLMHCLSPLPHERMTMEEVLQHPWFEQPQWRPEAVPDPPAVPIEAAARETSNPPPAVPSVTLPALSPGPGGATTSAGMPTQHRRGGAGGSGSVTPGLGSSGLEGDEDRATLRSAQAEPRGMSGMSSVFSSGVGSRGGWDDSSGLVSPGAVAAAASPARAVLSPPRQGGARAPQHPPPAGSTLMQTPLPDVLEGTGE